MILQAPYPAIRTTTILPEPEMSDGEALTDEVSVFHGMDGTLRTYIKTKDGRRRLSWDLRLARAKALELRAFVRVYFAEKIKITDHNNRAWIGNFISNPFEFTSSNAGRPDVETVRGETLTIRLEFEGTEQ